MTGLLGQPAGGAGRTVRRAASAGRCATSLPLKTRRTTTKNTGTKKTASTVAVIIPPITPVPIARWLAEPAPDETTSGSTPRMKAIEVIRIGRKRRCTASSVASIRSLPCACRSLANSMIRIAFFADRPMTVIRPTLKKTSFGHAAQRRAEHRAEHAERHHEQHRERDRPALVERRQAEEHREQREAEQDHRRRAREALLARLAGPLVARSRPAAAPASRSISSIASPVE